MENIHTFNKQKWDNYWTDIAPQSIVVILTGTCHSKLKLWMVVLWHYWEIYIYLFVVLLDIKHFIDIWIPILLVSGIFCRFLFFFSLQNLPMFLWKQSCLLTLKVLLLSQWHVDTKLSCMTRKYMIFCFVFSINFRNNYFCIVILLSHPFLMQCQCMCNILKSFLGKQCFPSAIIVSTCFKIGINCNFPKNLRCF